MAGYVRDHIVQTGMTRQAVEEQLGPPDAEKLECQQTYTEIMNQGGLSKDRSDCSISYNIGMCSLMDYCTLDVQFDEGNKVKQVRIVQH